MSRIPVSSLPIGIDISEAFDGFFYGNIIAAVLFGITIVQAWIYANSNTDKWPLRLLVAILVLLDFSTTCLNAQILHYYLVSNFGNLMNATLVTKTLMVEYFITLIIVLSVELFFASRVWILGKFHWIVPALIVMAALASTAAGIASIVSELENSSLLNYSGNKQKLEIGWNCSLAAVSDIIASVSLLWAFSSLKNGIKQTDTLLQKLFQYTVTRGLFVTIDQTTLVIIFLIKPERLWWTPFHFSLSKVYVITMIAMLNARDALRSNASANIITSSDMNIGPCENSFVGSEQPIKMNAVKSSNYTHSRQTGENSDSGDYEGSNERGVDVGKLDIYSVKDSIHINKEVLPPQAI
ncbi:hypothetical protein K435DRAFT_837139 [Dendrothele bispora CBS 962.96]|uniref:DUF6534 domain-containing protein n=1 Tax=Dendrothele bispora (strain CBS 962.96) TaxID=1314807 RepID=A0A4S8ME15_DENBC|nr:hypothetical protein K435DRAFT_837139 [Dendrothele bispora CBS 962.96]